MQHLEHGPREIRSEDNRTRERRVTIEGLNRQVRVLASPFDGEGTAEAHRRGDPQHPDRALGRPVRARDHPPARYLAGNVLSMKAFVEREGACSTA